MVNPDQRFIEEHRNQDSRTTAQVDRDRILYSTPFLRLAEVTQVVSADRGYVFHNRLTHSLKVAQLTRRLVEKLSRDQPRDVKRLGGLDPDAAEAAALAHDLGHPPFGHIAEDELDRLAKKVKLRDGFNGNAQSFRIVTKLAVGDPIDGKNPGRPVRGLNLTRATLDGILKYPWIHGTNSRVRDKWGAYKTERGLFSWVRKGYAGGSRRKCATAELMDWSDDITYAVHDLVDFYRAGQIPLDRLADKKDPSERKVFFDAVFVRRSELRRRRRQLEKAFQGVLGLFPIDRRYDGSLAQRCGLWNFTTVLISDYVSAIRLTDAKDSSRELVKIKPGAKDEILMLKELTWHYVILNHELATIQHGQRQAVRTVFETMLKAAYDKCQWSLFPLEYREELDRAGKDRPALKRIVTDFVASMTEREIKSLYHSLRGRA